MMVFIEALGAALLSTGCVGALQMCLSGCANGSFGKGGRAVLLLVLGIVFVTTVMTRDARAAGRRATAWIFVTATCTALGSWAVFLSWDRVCTSVPGDHVGALVAMVTGVPATVLAVGALVFVVVGQQRAKR